MVVRHWSQFIYFVFTKSSHALQTLFGFLLNIQSNSEVIITQADLISKLKYICEYICIWEVLSACVKWCVKYLYVIIPFIFCFRDFIGNVYALYSYTVKKNHSFYELRQKFTRILHFKQGFYVIIELLY